MKEIKKNGPVQMIFRVYSDFFMYKTGIYSRHPKAITLNDDISYHSISVYGWNFSTNGVPYWVNFEIKVILLFFLLCISIYKVCSWKLGNKLG
jgi:hypothetical protein